MATPTEMLAELRDRLADLPDRVAESVRLVQNLSPRGPAGTEAVPMASSVRDAVAGMLGGSQGDAPRPPAPGFGGFAPAPSPPPAPDFAAPEPPAAPPPGDLASPESSPPPAPPADSFASVAPPPSPPGADATPPLAGAGGGLDSGEAVALLRQIAGGIGSLGQGGKAPLPEGPRQVAWRGSWQAPQEGYAGGASPSMDVSNIAGAGGASSRRGYGTHQGGGRYNQPDPGDGGIPR